VGNVRLTALHTPGHTPEHLSFLTHDFASSDAPIGLLSGDFIFVGDVGRPDLLERAVQRTGTMEAAARTLFHSLQRTTSFPDHLQIWPGHGAGSACGKSLGAMPQSTLGYERLSNWAFGAITEEEFVKEVLDSQPTPPRYFARMKELNRDGVPDVRDRNDPQPLDARDFAAQRREGALIVDTRSAALFGGGHIEGALNVPFNRSFLTWAGSVVPYDRDLLLVVGSGQPVAEVCGLLSLVGLDRAVGYMALDVLPAIGGQHLDSITAITPGEAAADIESGRAVVLDVRDEHELRTGTLNGAINIPLGVLADHMDELPRDKRIVVYCRSGSRSAIAAALLRASGRGDSVNLAGGIEGWSKTGQPVAEVSAA
jgi:hydroxyacylglutathione hydrolase